jgi:hypothetical protein
MRFSIVTLLVAVASFGLAAVAGAEQRYTDATGDAGAAPDLGQVVVSNDATTVLLDIAIPARLPEPDEAYLVIIASDSNAATGENGTDVRVFETGGAGNAEVWNGSAWVDAPSAGIRIRVEIFADGGRLLVELPRTLLGNTSAFRFIVMSAKFSGEEIVATDFAPGDASWEYSLKLAQCSNGSDDDADGKVDAADLGCRDGEDDLESDNPYTLAIGRPTVTPSVGRAGKLVTVKARVAQVESRKPITTGAVRCMAKIGPATRRWPGQLTTGTAMCRLMVPKPAKSTTIRGSITVSSKSKTASTSFAFRVR